MKRWLPLILLASAQFIMVLDTTVMNVAITQVVADLDTTVQSMQAAITFYTLVMAAFMLAGAKFGDIIGRKRAFLIGLGVYGTGSLITAMSVNMTMLYVGWSVIEGIGAVLVIPAIAALVVGNYSGSDRALAYGVLGGVAAAGAAAGPLIGGWMTTYASWRWVFVGEVGLVLLVVLFRGYLAAPPPAERRPRFDFIGTALSASGLGLVVFAILQTSAWGWVKPRGALTIGSTEITPLGLSVVPFLIAAGVLVLTVFEWWQRRLTARGDDPLLDIGLLRVPQMRAGLASMVAMQMMILGLFFIIPVFLQIVVGLDAFETGLRIMPMSLAMLVGALVGPRLGAIWSPRRITWVGLTGMLISCLMLVQVVDITLRSTAFISATLLFGAGAGLLASQMGNVIMSSVDRSRSSEAGGLQGTAQNLGASLGTALIGSILVGAMTTAFYTGIESNPDVPKPAVEQLVTATKSGVPIVTTEQAEAALKDTSIAADEADAIVSEYESAQLDALRSALFGLAALAFAGFWMSRGLPRTAGTPAPAPTSA